MVDVDPKPDDAHGNIEAYTPTPTGAIIRLRCHENSDGDWVQAVEVVAQDGETVTRLYEGTGAIKPCATYNQTIDVYAEMHDGCETVEEAFS